MKMNSKINNYLIHHGIKGQKWGVRRFQNKDGSLTVKGKERRIYSRNVKRNLEYVHDKNEIVKSLSKEEKNLLGASLDEDWIPEEHAVEISSNIAKTFLTKYNDKPISFLEIWTNGGRTGQIALATRPDEEYRGKGYASENVKKAIDWVERYGYKSIDELEWWADVSNEASNKLAKKYGFEFVRTGADDTANLYKRAVKKGR